MGGRHKCSGRSVWRGTHDWGSEKKKGSILNLKQKKTHCKIPVGDETDWRGNSKHPHPVVSRLQGDSLSYSRSEEEPRPHVSEQAVPDISCKLHNTAQIQSDFLLHFCGLTLCSVLFIPVCLCVCVCVLSGAAPLPRVDTVAGRLQECDALSQVSASVSVLPTSITKQLRSLYSHQLPSSSLLLYLKKKKHLKPLWIGQHPSKTIHLYVGILAHTVDSAE